MAAGLLFASRIGCAIEDAYLKATVSFREDASALVIINNDSFSWTDCRLVLNPHGSGTEYSLTRAIVPVGENHVFVSEFAEDDGTRFDIGTHKLIALFISCSTPMGRRWYAAGPAS